ncbi:hypothetical protein EJ110_NYTH31548 [Nymphaea thermarum]|nr:hypothetical protein EJ110_NYTH31548 [Nymphaea thermarum]
MSHGCGYGMAEGTAVRVFGHDNFENCGNISIEVGMCPPGEWEKLSKDTWIGSMSPYDYRLLDICMPPPFLSLEVSTEEETKLFRLIFLVLGALLIILSPEMSKSVMFYYSNAMILGIVLVILIVLFQGMKLLPTGRKRSLMIFLYGSIVGLGTVILRYLSGLLHSVLSDIGLNEDIYNPVALFLLVCLVLAGAWLGFWGVRKLVLSEDGAVDASVSLFVRWAIRIFGAVMITQSSLDPLLATGALVFAAFFLPTIRTAFGDGIFYHWLMKRFSKEEWDAFTKDETRKALKELVSSPEFGQWAVNNAERITLSPANQNDRGDTTSRGGRWFRWF